MREVIRRRRWRDDQSGMSLIEIMIAVFVLSVGLLALASTAITSIVNLRVSRGRQEATDAASALIEDLRRTDYATVALDRNDPDVLLFVQANGGTASGTGGCDPVRGEPLVTSAQAGAIPLEQAFGPSGRVTVTTTVTWYDEDGDGACPDPGDQRVKRVKVVAAWSDGDRDFSVEESTLIAPVDRGLPAPDFRLGTPTATLIFTEDDRDNSRERCVGHVLRNLGAEDGYEFQATRSDGGTVSRQGDTLFYSTSSSKWTVRAFMEFPPQEPPLDPSTLSIPAGHNNWDTGHAGLELLKDSTGDGNDNPEGQFRLEAGDQARLWICYRSGTSLSVGDVAKWEIKVNSQFDPNRVETLEHEVRVSNNFLDMYLYDDDTSSDGQSGARALTRPSGTQYLPIMPMGPQTTLQPERLGTSALPNYDTDFDGLPGLGLASTSTHPTANSVVFHEQVNQDTTFASVIEATLWTASGDALVAQQSGAATVAPQRVTYRARLHVLDKNEKHVQSTPLPDVQILAYSHDVVGWKAQTISIGLPSGFSVAKDQYVHLVISCDAGASTDTCHLAYDNTAHPARFRLGVAS